MICLSCSIAKGKVEPPTLRCRLRRHAEITPLRAERLYNLDVAEEEPLDERLRLSTPRLPVATVR